MEFVNSSGLANRENAKAPLLMSFSCIFSKHEELKRKKWREVISTLGEPAKALFTRSIDQLPSDLLDQIPVSPEKNDMNWACFFATGDLRYLNGIIETLQYLEERSDINLFLTAASAKWSLSSNARSHMTVRVAMEAMKVGDVPDMRLIAEDILTKKPQKIREETVVILKSQKESGVWK